MKKNTSKKTYSKISTTTWIFPFLSNPPQIDPIFRVRIQNIFNQYFPGKGTSMEEFLAVNCFHKPDLYEEHACQLIYALNTMPPDDLKYYQNDLHDGHRIFVSLDRKKLFPNSTYEQEYKQQKLKNTKFETLTQKLTDNSKLTELLSDTNNNSAQLKCRHCGSIASIYFLHTRSMDEPMTVFLTCKNNQCGKKWKLS
jgi:DNA-directed RNA polymerase subunit M/transcription elongation factor TFIIS